jgi:hypothetical protein
VLEGLQQTVESMELLVQLGLMKHDRKRAASVSRRERNRLGQLECAGLAHPTSSHAPLGGEEDATADVRTLWTAPLTEAAFDGGPPFAHSPVGHPGNQRFTGSKGDTVTEQFPSIVVGLK